MDWVGLMSSVVLLITVASLVTAALSYAAYKARERRRPRRNSPGESEVGAFFHLYKRAANLLRLGPFFQEEPSLIFEGTPRIFEAPEFQDMRRTRRLLKALEEKRELEEILRRDLSAEEVKLHIGSENRETSLTDCTVVAAPYRLRGGVMGSIGVIGPTRMNYPRVTALVGRMAQAVTRCFQGRE